MLAVLGATRPRRRRSSPVASLLSCTIPTISYAAVLHRRRLSSPSRTARESIQLKEYRFESLKAQLCNLARVGSTSAALYVKMNQRLAELSEEFSDAVAVLTAEKTQLHPQDIHMTSTPTEKNNFSDPTTAQCKGRRKKPTRFQPAADMKTKKRVNTTATNKVIKRRTCSQCNQQAGHNARTCPLRGGTQKISVRHGSNDSEEEEEPDIDDDEVETEEEAEAET